MKALIRFPSFYFSFPILLSCAVMFATFDPPSTYLAGVLLLVCIAFIAIGADIVLKIRLPEIYKFRELDFSGSREALVVLAFCYVIIIFCLIDITFFPIPLFGDPSTYATFDGGREHIRHISDMSWILPPVALLCLRNKVLRNLFIVTGFAFPIVVLDRNRLFAALFSFLLILIFRRKSNKRFPWKTVGFFGFSGAAGFSALGILRSGTLSYIFLPFSNFYIEAPLSIKWLLLYTSAGVYNFSAILAKEYQNSEFLLTQLLPFHSAVATAATDIPLDAKTINVGTEFFPFLMALGPLGVLLSALCLYIMLLWSVRLLRGRISIFSILIFLRLAYVCIMSPFAPQAFTWTNLGFLFLCLFLKILASILPVRKKQVGETYA